MGFGDEIMVTAQARSMWEKSQRPVQVHDLHGRARWHELWDNNPIMSRPGLREHSQVLVNGPGARPYIAGKTSIKWAWQKWNIRPGEIYLTDEEKLFAKPYANRIIIDPNIKAGASPNKDWGWPKWTTLALEAEKRGVKFTQLGPSHTRRLMRAEFIPTQNIRKALAVLSVARAAVVTEGALHHAAAAFNLPAVVIFGGYISPEITGYAMHRNIFTGNVACGSRILCNHCIQSMAKISSTLVLNELMDILNKESAYG